MRLISRWVSRLGRSLRAARIALDPGEDDPGEHEDGRPPQCTPDPADRIVLTRDDLLWCTTSEDAERRITLGLLDCSPHGIGVLVDDNGEALGLRLSRTEAQDLHRSLVTWLAHTGRPVTTGTTPRRNRRSGPVPPVTDPARHGGSGSGTQPAWRSAPAPRRHGSGGRPLGSPADEPGSGNRVTLGPFRRSIAARRWRLGATLGPVLRSCAESRR